MTYVAPPEPNYDEDVAEDLTNDAPDVVDVWTVERMVSIPYLNSVDEAIMLARGVLHTIYLTYGVGSPKLPRDDQRDQVFRLFAAVAKREKIKVIKEVRIISGWGLKPAKEITETIQEAYAEELNAIELVFRTANEEVPF